MTHTPPTAEHPRPGRSLPSFEGPGLSHLLNTTEPVVAATSRHPLVARAERTPWSGYWWPMELGELALGWEDGQGRRRITACEARCIDAALVSPTEAGRQRVYDLLSRQGRDLSPLIKFDLWSRSFLASVYGEADIPWPLVSRSARWELDYHVIGDNPDHRHFKARSYAGKCIGWALANFEWDEPTGCKVIDGVYFTPADIKGLLASLYSGAQFFVPDVNFKGNTYRDEPGHDSQEFYDDVRPDEFVRALFATIAEGRLLEADLDPGPDVWNHPIYRYELVPGPVIGRRCIVEAVIGIAEDDVPVDAVFSLEPTRSDLREKRYRFELTLPQGTDDIADAIDGRWLGDSVSDHPDTLILGFEADWCREILNYRDTRMREEFNFSLVKRFRMGREWTSIIDILLARYFGRPCACLNRRT